MQDSTVNLSGNMSGLALILTGQMSGPVFIAAMIFAILGFVLSKLLSAKKRDKESPRTPYNWDWNFWVRDNYQDFLKVVISLYVFVRFAPELLSWIMPDIYSIINERYDIMFIYLLVGFFLTRLLTILKNKTKSDDTNTN